MLNKKALFILFALFFVNLSFLTTFDSARADIQSVSITPLVGDNEDPERFDVSGQPGTVKTLKMSITNFGIETVNLKIQPTNATTSTEGQFEFSDKVVVGNYGLKHAFADMTSPKTIQLKKNQTKEVSFQVTLPSQQLSGTIISGFDVYDIKHPDDGHSGVGVYFDTVSAKDNHPIKLNGITPEVHNSQPYLMVNLANYQTQIIQDTTVQIKIKKNNWYNKLGLANKTEVQDVHFDKIAPNSRIPVQFNQKQTPIQPGNYLVEGIAKNNEHVWKFKQNVKIEPVAAQMINSEAKNLIYDKTGIYILIVGVLICVIVLVFWSISYQRR